jgi:glycosyltransferase involved in cell wall biosynthesis
VPTRRGSPPIQSLRALHLISNLERGGGQEVVRTLVRALPATGVQPVVATFQDGPLRDAIEREAIAVEVVPGRRLPASAGIPALQEARRIVADLGAIIRRHDIDVVQTHLLRSMDWPTLLLRREPNRPAVLWTVHNALLELRRDQVPGRGWTVGPKRLAHRIAYAVGTRIADAVVAVSPDVARAVRSSYRPPAGRLVTIPNGVDVERYGQPVQRAEMRHRLGVPPDGPLVVVVAKLMAQKGHGDFLDALPTIRAAHPGLQVAFLGEGDLEPSLRARVDAEGHTSVVRFLGNRSDVPDVLATADLFVLPSLWEGLPMALLEGMATGLPVVATEVSGTRDVVEHERSGLLVPPSAPRELAAAIVRVLGDPGLASALGTAARRRVEDRYSARAQARRHAELYRRVIERRARA